MADLKRSRTAEACGVRQRKKKLINDVRQQLEFYFSSANLQKDLFMKELLAKDPYIDLELFKKFNKMKLLSTEPQILKKAVETSHLLELSDDKLGVKRKIPVQAKENEMECTIYIENVPIIADHTWIKNIFSQYGTIDYISLPKFKDSGNAKGFAFVEFQTESQAHNAIAAYRGMTSFGEVESKDLLSIQTFSKSETEHTEFKTKRTLSDEAIAKCPQSKKIKEDTDDKSGGKKKKKRKRKTKEKEPQTESIYLKVMSKTQWKKLRNEYLNTMRGNRKFSKEYFGTNNSQNQIYKDELTFNMSKMPVFVPNVVVMFKIEDMPKDKKIFKQSITDNYSGVAYVELNHLLNIVHIRFETSENASAFMQSDTFDNKSLLTGDEEEAYWESLYAAWMKGRNKQIKKIARCGNLPSKLPNCSNATV